MQKITPFLWFDNNAEEAMNFYISVFSAIGLHSKVISIARYGDEVPGMKGKVLTAVFELGGQRFMAIDGGPHFKFTEAISLMVDCKTQEEVDELWDKLSEGGDKNAQQCGWLKDKYGLSWQIIPAILGEMLSDKDPEKAKRVMQAMMQMKKIDTGGLRKAYEG